MTPELIATIITVTAGLVVPALSYFFTKRHDREAEWRREKLAYYKAFTASLSGIVVGHSTAEALREFALASNNLQLFAPQSVVDALHAFRHETRASNPSPSRDTHDRLLSALMMAIRKDVGVSPTDNSKTFKAVLWSSNPNGL